MRAVLFLLALGFSVPSWAAPKVVTSIKPVNDLVMAVMEGVGEPTRLIPPGSSPHTYALKPSERQAAEQADLLFWIGPNVETALEKVAHNLPAQAQAIALIDAPGMTVLPARTGGDWERKRKVAEHTHGDHVHKGSEDGHIWLSPANARIIVQVVADTLSERDPQNAAKYRANADKAVQRLSALENELKAQLAPVEGKPFIVFHDAYQYFEHAFGLKAAGSILVSPDAMASAKRVNEMQDKIKQLGATCVFSEPQFEPKLVGVLIEGTSARSGVLDPLGAKLPNGLEGYVQLLSALAHSLRQCLAP